MTHQWVALHPACGGEAAAEARAVLAAVPPAASVSASGHVVPHLSRRARIYQFPNPFVAVCTGPGRKALGDQLRPESAATARGEMERGLAAGPVDFIVIGTRVPLPPGDRERIHLWASPEVVAALRSPQYGLIGDSAGIWLLRRGAPHAPGLRRLGLRPEDSAARFQEVIMERFAGPRG